jgi:hypothetical protein
VHDVQRRGAGVLLQAEGARLSRRALAEYPHCAREAWIGQVRETSRLRGLSGLQSFKASRLMSDEKPIQVRHLTRQIRRSSLRWTTLSFESARGEILRIPGGSSNGRWQVRTDDSEMLLAACLRAHLRHRGGRRRRRDARIRKV